MQTSATRHRVYMDWLSPHWLSCQRNSRIDVKARYDMYQPNGKSNMQRTQYEAGLNFHIGKRISILTEYALINDKTLAKHNYSMADAEVCFRF